MRSAGDGWLPIDSPQVGLLTWYAPAGAAMALVTSWLGIIDDAQPELRAGCRSRTPGPELFPSGADFAVNLLVGTNPPALGDLLQQPSPGCPVLIGAGPELLPGRRVHAPLLASCPLQIECRYGRFLPRNWEAELAGDILLLQRGDLGFDPADYPDFLALHPLRLLGVR